jgi:hypothetical protein
MAMAFGDGDEVERRGQAHSNKLCESRGGVERKSEQRERRKR